MKLIVAVFSLVILMAVEIHASFSVKENYFCHPWTGECYMPAEYLTTNTHLIHEASVKKNYFCHPWTGECYMPAEYLTTNTHLIHEASVKENYFCHHWTAEDLAAGAGGGVEKEREQCESYLGYVFTQGQNEDYPNCEGCWCCKPEAYKCYHWSEEEKTLLSEASVAEEKKQCERHKDFIFQGNSLLYQYCGGCWCCQPVYECYHWTDKDIKVMGAGKGTPEVERARCEDDLGFIFTQGQNENFPGTAGCWCIQPRS